MTVNEHKLLGDIFLMTLIAFFGIALPAYSLVRLIWPESDWNLGGSVSTSVIKPLDLLVATGFIVLFVFSWKLLTKNAGKVDPEVLTTGKVVSSSLGMLLFASVVPAVLYWRINLMEFFGLRWDRWMRIFWIVPAFVVGMMVLGGLMYFLGWHKWVEGNYGAKPQDMVTLIKETPDMALLWSIVISAVVVAPLAEEIIFRGYLYPVVKRYTERWFAALFTGVLFGVIHFNLMGLPQLAIMGVILVVLYELTGSLWVVMGCHAAFNATSIGMVLLARLYQFPGAP